MSQTFVFEKMKVWEHSRSLVKSVYKLISDFPKEERFGLSDQLRRAVVSVASNIPEGAGRPSLKEKIHFTEISYGSLMEVVCQIMLANDLNLISEENKKEILIEAENIAKQLSAFRNNLISRLNSSPLTLNSKNNA